MPNYKFSTEPVDVPLINTKNRTIATEIPAPGTQAILNKLKKYESRSMHGQLPIIWKKDKT